MRPAYRARMLSNAKTVIEDVLFVTIKLSTHTVHYLVNALQERKDPVVISRYYPAIGMERLYNVLVERRT